jgi:hypothetical protein
MSWKHWFVLGTFLAGFTWSPAWLASLVMFELGIRHGRDVAAFWFESKISSRGSHRD